jgi:hypothetical protein
MKLNKTILNSILVLIMTALLTSCLFRGNSPIEYPLDIPLPEFFIGRWTSEPVSSDERDNGEYEFELVVIDEKTLKLSLLSQNGRFLDGYTSKYFFTAPDEIFVDTIRIDGGEHWVLDREGEKLIVYREVNGNSNKIVFRR